MCGRRWCQQREGGRADGGREGTSPCAPLGVGLCDLAPSAGALVVGRLEG